MKIPEFVQMQTTPGRPSFRTSVVYKPNQGKTCSFLNSKNNNKTSPNWKWERIRNIIFLLIWGWKHIGFQVNWPWLHQLSDVSGARITGRREESICMPTVKTFLLSSPSTLKLASLEWHKLIADAYYLEISCSVLYEVWVFRLWFLKMKHLSRI